MNASAAVAAIAKLQATLRRLAEVPAKVAKEAEKPLTDLLQKQFRQGADPYGKPWAPLAASTLRKHGPPPLTGLSRRLSTGTRAIASRYGIRIIVGAAYGAFHQLGFRNGKKRVPARRILPQYGLPRDWKRVLDDAAKRAAHAAVSGR